MPHHPKVKGSCLLNAVSGSNNPKGFPFVTILEAESKLTAVMCKQVANSSSTVVNYLPHYPKVKGLCLLNAASGTLTIPRVSHFYNSRG